MPVATSSSAFFNAVVDNLAYNNKYKLEIVTSPTLQQMIEAYDSGTYLDYDSNNTTAAFTSDNNYISLMCKATSFPARDSAETYIHSENGKRVPLFGDSVFDNKWSATFYNDKEHRMRNFFLKWIDIVHNWDSSKKGNRTSDIYVTGSVFQARWMQTNDSYIKSAGYEFTGLFPVRIGSIALDELEPVTVQEFTVDFSYFDFKLINI